MAGYITMVSVQLVKVNFKEVFAKNERGEYRQGCNAGKVISEVYTHLLYCSVLSLSGNVNTRRMSKPDMGSIFHIKKSMTYSGHTKLLCEFSKLSKFNAFYLFGY